MVASFRKPCRAWNGSQASPEPPLWIERSVLSIRVVVEAAAHRGKDRELDSRSHRGLERSAFAVDEDVHVTAHGPRLAEHAVAQSRMHDEERLQRLRHRRGCAGELDGVLSAREAAQ